MKWLINESIKSFEIKTSVVFNLSFADNTTLSSFFLFILIINLNFLIPGATTQTFDPTAEMAIPIGMPTNRAKVETETESVTVETKISKFLM